MILYLDTSNFEEATIELREGAKVLTEERIPAKRQLSQKLIPTIDKMFKQSGLDKKELSNIEVNLGPGSFTGIRIGVSVANALGYSLGIPVNGTKQLPVLPEYGAEPNITMSEKNKANGKL